MPITQQQIAEKLGLNQRTVSAAFGATGRLNPETRRMILKAAQEMGYRPNRLATALRGSQSRSIGVIWPFVEPWGGDGIIGLDVLERLQRKGYATYQAQGSGDVALLCRQLDDFLARRVDAIVVRVIPSQLRHRDVAQRLSAAPAAVAVSRQDDPAFAGDLVIHDRNRAIRDVVDHLARTGRKRPAMVTSIPEESNPPKFEAFRDQCRVHGIADHPNLLIDMGLPTAVEEHGQLHVSAFRKQFPSKVDADALFCFNDIGALCLMRELQDRGLRVPEDVAVVGFNNTEAGRIWRPTLASGDRKAHEVAAAVDEMLSRRMTEASLPPQRQTIAMEFIPRQSAG